MEGPRRELPENGAVVPGVVFHDGVGLNVAGIGAEKLLSQILHRVLLESFNLFSC